MTEQDHAQIERHVAPLRDLLGMHLTLLQQITRELMRHPVPFGVVTTNNANLIVQQNKRGVIKCIGNPTDADLQVTIYDGADGGNGTPKFNGVLAPGETRAVHLVFHSGLLSMSESGGATLDGELYS